MEYQFIKAPLALMRMLDGTTFQLLLTIMSLPEQKDGTKLIKRSYIMDLMGMKSHHTLYPHIELLKWLKLITVEKSDNCKGWPTNKCTINYNRIADADKLSYNKCRKKRTFIEEKLKEYRKIESGFQYGQDNAHIKNGQYGQKSTHICGHKTDTEYGQKSAHYILDNNYILDLNNTRKNLLENASQIDVYLFDENEINLLKRNMNTGSPTVQEICNAYLSKRGIDSTKVFDKYLNIERRKLLEVS